jgi:hypothetical protein
MSVRPGAAGLLLAALACGLAAIAAAVPGTVTAQPRPAHVVAYEPGGNQVTWPVGPS